MDNNENNYDNNTPNQYSPDDYYQTPEPNNAPNSTPQPPVNPTNNLALASMIAGIFALISCCLPPLQFILGVVSIVLVIFSKKGKPWSGFAIAGLVMAIIALLISIAMVLYVVLAYSMMRDPQFAPIFNDIYQMYESMPVQ